LFSFFFLSLVLVLFLLLETLKLPTLQGLLHTLKAFAQLSDVATILTTPVLPL
jgi:hypothetical protein